jgi:hypothetical protein
VTTSIDSVNGAATTWFPAAGVKAALALTLLIGTLLAAAPRDAAAHHDDYCGHGVGPAYTHYPDALRRNVFVLHAFYYTHWHLYKEQELFCAWFWCRWWNTERQWWKACPT